jgi:hypothetical protein
MAGIDFYLRRLADAPIIVSTKSVLARKSISRLGAKFLDYVRERCKDIFGCEELLEGLLCDLELSPGEQLRYKTAQNK